MAKRPRNYAAEYARRVQAARARGATGYYQERLQRARRARPGITTGAARGHARGGERAAQTLVRAVRRLPADGQIAFTGVDRQPDGTWLTARFDLLNGGDQTFLVTQDGLHMLPHIADVIAATGINVLGAKYLAKMVDAQDEQLYAIRGRKGRHVVSIYKKSGRAKTTADLADAAIFRDEASARRYLGRYKLGRRGYRVVEL